MSKPWIHSKNSARKFGGKPEDYMPIHNLMDSSHVKVTVTKDGWSTETYEHD